MSQKGKLDPASVLDDDEPAAVDQQHLGSSASLNLYAMAENMRKYEPAMEFGKIATLLAARFWQSILGLARCAQFESTKCSLH
jgi:hypothetical protein